MEAQAPEDHFPHEAMRQLGLDDPPTRPEAELSDANSDAVTEDPEFDADSMLDMPEQNVGDTEDITYDKIVTKEILEVGEGVKKPSRYAIARISYKCYFYDHNEIETVRDEFPVKMSIGDATWPEGLWKAVERMR